jgi:tetraacyldisaccharide 4'-kinase
MTKRKNNILLYPFSVIYGFITATRNFLYNTGFFKSAEFRIPIICVGNITVGGTGKTPHTEYLIGLLHEHFKIAVLSRGYKRKTRGFIVAERSSTVRDIGDEPKQISLKFPDVLVVADRNRVDGVKEIMNTWPQTEAVILDDGFQHRKIKPGFSILLTDYSRLMINDHMLPYGNLRENVDNKSRADIIIVSKSPENINPMQRRIIVKDVGKAPYQHLYFTSLSYKSPLPVFEDTGVENSGADMSLSHEGGAILVTGIANAEPLKQHLNKTFAEIIHISFPDHHNFRETDIKNILTAFNELKTPVKYVFTTEKDAVRLREFTNIADSFKSSIYYIPIGINFLNDDKEEFDKIIIDYVRKNKGNNRFSKVKGNKQP